MTVVVIVLVIIMVIVVCLVLAAVQFGHNIGSVALKAKWIGLELTVNRAKPLVERAGEPEPPATPDPGS